MIDLTLPGLDLDPPIEPWPQGVDVLLCTLTLSGFAVSATDRPVMHVKEAVGDVPVGKLDKPENFVVDPNARTVQVWLRGEQTARWFRKTNVTEQNRVRVLKGTYLHNGAGGGTVARPDGVRFEGLELQFPFCVGYTRDL